MDFLPWRLRLCFAIYVHVVLLSWSESAVEGSGNETDKLALLAFKAAITQDPQQVLSSWNDSNHFCDWIGVTCLSNERVVTLSLESLGLVGSVSPSVGNLSFLTGINLRRNNFNGKIPEELGRLSHLQYLNLSYNSFDGEIPLNITHCLDLRVLDLVYNELIGEIPNQLSSLEKLVILGLGANNLTGTLPPWIGNFSSLISLSLRQNMFHGSIPNEFGRLPQLGLFVVFSNMLSGIVPPSLYNISSINYFSLTNNQLHGGLPSNLGLTLPNLEVFAGAQNNFAGPFPDSLSNASGLQVIDFSENAFTGAVPLNFGSLRALIRLNFGDNLLESGQGNDLNVITSLANCTSLQVLGLDYNRLGGELPESVANLSASMKLLAVGGNLIRGSLPTGIENLVNLTVLGLEDNLLSGSIPFGVGKLQKLQRLHFHENRFSGRIPSSLGNLTQLNLLFMQHNRFEGSIPSSLGDCQKLLVLNISRNNLTGTIPKKVLTISSLSISFAVAHNSLSGSIPLEVGNLKNLGELEVSGNKLSGEIPVTLANCLSLERLQMGGNSFQGNIPQVLKALRGIQAIDFSHNNLSGQIPEFLTTVSSLKYLDLSFNDLDGEVPNEGIFLNASANMVRGNKKLCSGIKELQLPLCAKQAIRTSSSFFSARVIIFIVIGILLFVLLSFFGLFYCFRNSRKNNGPTATSSGDCWKLGASYSEIFKSTNGFSSDCLIGEGSFGSVYKGVMNDGKTVFAIKVLKLQQEGASKSFIAECDALKNLRHRNLIKIITVCSSLDFEGNDFKALVFEFMHKGNLEQWLHPSTNGSQQLKILSLLQRLNIAIDVAYALEYLHYDCEETIAHCDLKPSNILLDEDMTAHVGDFGLARFLPVATNALPRNQTISFGLKGSIGYIPPEYGQGGQVSVLGDVYSYGIILLEMFTGKKPTDEMFKDGLSIYDFVQMALPNRVVEVIDPILLSQIGYGDAKESEETPVLIQDESCSYNVGSGIEECLVSVITIGLSCCAPSPKERMAVRDVVNKLNEIRDSFLRSPQHIATGICRA